MSRSRFSLRCEMRMAAERVGEIKIYSVIDSWSWGEDDPSVTADKFDKMLKGLGDVDTLVIRINSPGGVVSEAVAMRTMLINHPAKKVVDIEGYCCSAATLFATIPGAKVRIAKGAEFMIHRPISGRYGNADEMLSAYNYLKKGEEDIADMYAARTGKTAAEMLDAMKAETWYTAQEAVDAGFCDEVMPEEDLEAAACATEEAMAARAELISAGYTKVPEDLRLAIRDARAVNSALDTVSNGEPAVATGLPAENTPKEGTAMEPNETATAEMTLEQLRTEHPELLAQAAQEAVRAERERVDEIDALTPPGEKWAQMAAQAKADGTSSQDFFRMVVAKQREQAKSYLEARARETAPAENVQAGDTADNDGEDAEQTSARMAKEVAEMNVACSTRGMF